MPVRPRKFNDASWYHPRMSSVRTGLALALLLTACDKASQPPAPSGNAAPTGLPTEGAPMAKGEPGGAAAAGGQAMANPHAGMDMGGGGADPHAGMDMGGGESPHGSGAPTAPVDPNQVLSGMIDVAPALKAQVKEGDILFLSVRSVGADGTVQRVPIAVDRVDVGKLPMPFELTQANVMMQGLKFEGNVQITARLDRDGEATSREPGDVEGLLKATIPTKGLKLVLDTPIK